MKANFKKDYQFGKQNESEILPIIKDFFDDDIKQINYMYSTYDFRGNKGNYELKSRNNKLNDYKTTLIGKNKIDKMIKYNTDSYFLFKYIDGLYYIKYDDNEFKKFKCQNFVRNKREDFNDIEQKYYFIPIEKLNLICLF